MRQLVDIDDEEGLGEGVQRKGRVIEWCREKLWIVGNGYGGV